MAESIEKSVAIKSAWMILEGLGFDRARNSDLERTVLVVFESAPAADVVAVVRCRDCRYAYDSVSGWCCSHGVCVDCIVREDFFCACGERKDGGQDE